MNKKLLAACFAVAFGAGSGIALNAYAQVKPDVLVKQRQGAMSLIGKYWGPINGMAQGKVPFNADVAARNAAFLDALSQMPWDAFTADTKDLKTRALPSTYEDAAKFKEAQDQFRNTVIRLVKAARDEAALKAAAAEVGKSCGACHEGFRAK